MSWNIVLVGKPANVAAALEVESTKLSGASKVEFDAALPHFVALCNENFGNDQQVIKLSASGHGYGEVNRNCTVSIESFYATLC